MKFNFDKIKHLMQGNHNQPLPPELDWSNMKDGIFDKMKSIEKEESFPSKNQYSRKRIGLFLVLFFALAFVVFSLSQRMTQDQLAEACEVVQLPETEETDIPPNASNHIAKVAPVDQMEYSAKPLVEKNRRTNFQDLLPTFNKSEPTLDPEKSESTPADSDQLLTYQPRQENDSLHDTLNTDRVGASQRTLTTAQPALPSMVETKLPEGTPPIPALQALPPYISDQIGPEKLPHSIPDIQQMNDAYLPGAQPATFPNQLIVEGGMTFWDQGYGNNKPERAQYETPLSSFQLQGHYKRSFNRNYFVMAGLQYQQLENRFDYINTIQDYKITLQDTILQVQNNLLTGEQSIIRGDAEQLVPAERRVRHYNKTQLFKVSMAIGKSWRFHSFQTDVYLGGALNTLVRNQGRMFHEDAIIDYDGSSNTLFQNQWTADGVLGVRLQYFLTQNVGVTTGFQAQKSLMNWSNQDDLPFHPASFGLQLGLSYSL